MKQPTETRPRRRATTIGMTLTELMIVIVIVGILAAAAVPAYRGYIERAQRTEAKSMLGAVSTNQERFYLQNNTYTADCAALGFPGCRSEFGRYTLDFTVAPDVTGYTARATPAAGGGQERDTDCAWFTLDARGVRDAGPGANCWQ